jgi:hypothetical protein
VFITSPPPNVTSYDVFLTTAGDVLIATGVPTRTPVPGEPGEFITHVDLTVVGGSGKYAQATGTMTFDGRSHTGTCPANRRSRLPGNRVWAECQRRRTEPCC